VVDDDDVLGVLDDVFPLVVEFEFEFEFVGAEDWDWVLDGSMAITSKEVERISSRRTLARRMTDLESRRICSPKRDRKLVFDDVDEGVEEGEGSYVRQPAMRNISEDQRRIVSASSFMEYSVRLGYMAWMCWWVRARHLDEVG
jgi:hypothetical protein